MTKSHLYKQKSSKKSTNLKKQNLISTFVIIILITITTTNMNLNNNTNTTVEKTTTTSIGNST